MSLYPKYNLTALEFLKGKKKLCKYYSKEIGCPHIWLLTRLKHDIIKLITGKTKYYTIYYYCCI